MMKAETCLLHSVGDGHRLEVATVMNYARFTVDQRIVGCYGNSMNIDHMERRVWNLLELHSMVIVLNDCSRSSTWGPINCGAVLRG